MKFLWGVSALTSVLLGGMSVAHATSTGKIEFSGELIAASCTVSPGAGSAGGNGNINVDLGKVSLSDVGEPGTGSAAAAATQINLDIDCSSGVGGLSTVKVKFDPLSGSGIDSADGRLLKLQSGEKAAKGIAIAIINDDNKVLNLSANETIDAALKVDEGKATANLSMRAAYALTGASDEIKAGVGNATLPFTLTYE
ncbi:Fimbrial protein precursor [Pseudomonas synxantha]|uniref:fimbrial protein n=1 Tax=Pseudomonas synxantha TaxID=47883 RepID=UPI000F586B65|nr:fimbrial protein [Pseudomonas synxantha]AZE72381.1 Fimbrial protein precursor [Pseudomonas synxantha]AZE78050.1 Fimbrial protein precursor [Pseudomonas synxantha]